METPKITILSDEISHYIIIAVAAAHLEEGYTTEKLLIFLFLQASIAIGVSYSDSVAIPGQTIHINITLFM